MIYDHDLCCFLVFMLTNEQLEKVCDLAKLKLNEKDKVAFLEKLNHVFGFIEQLSNIDTSEIDINNLAAMDSTPERTDTSEMLNSREELLSNTKDKKFDMFCVPKVVE